MQIFLNEYQEIFTNIISIKNLTISEEKTTFPDGYLKADIIDIHLGIRKIDQQHTKKESKEDICKQIAEIEDEIQRKKILLGRILPLGDMAKIKAKKEEIEQLKSHLLVLKEQQ